jgi:hypothetical protein
MWSAFWGAAELLYCRIGTCTGSVTREEKGQLRDWLARRTKGAAFPRQTRVIITERVRTTTKFLKGSSIQFPVIWLSAHHCCSDGLSARIIASFVVLPLEETPKTAHQTMVAGHFVSTRVAMYSSTVAQYDILESHSSTVPERGAELLLR